VPRYKPDLSGQSQLVPVDFAKQVLPGTFEHALAHLIDHKLDCSAFDARYSNDETGATAYDPRVLLKIVLLGYSRGLISSRRMEAACRENVVFMAISGGEMPHFTTLAGFVAENATAIVALFREVLVVCNDMGLIGHEHFAIDGVKLPSNASKEWSGRRVDFEKKLSKCETAAQEIVRRHRQRDKQEPDQDGDDRDQRTRKKLEANADKLRDWLSSHADVVSKRGYVKTQNITDPDSAKMKTSHGVIQGYTGVAAVDDRHQVIVYAEAFGEGQEQSTLAPVIDGLSDHLDGMNETLSGKRITADAGYHSEANVELLYTREIDGYVADVGMRGRDPRFAEVDRHIDPRELRQQQKRRAARFQLNDFSYDAERGTCYCPEGHQLAGPSQVAPNGYEGVRFQGRKQLCGACPSREKCLRDPAQSKYRQVVFFSGKTETVKYAQRMQQKIDTVEGRRLYGRRLGTVEPVFGHLRTHKRLDRFTLRSKRKVNAQWLLYCLVHNITKLMKVPQIGHSTS
jgi:transposase